MDTAILTLVLTLAVASVLMVLAMVRFSVAIVAEPERPAAIKAWGWIYAAVWSVIVIVIVRLSIAGGATWPQVLAGVTLVVGGWGTFHSFWVWLWLSLDRTKGRAAGQAVRLTPAREDICRRARQLAVGGLIAVVLAVIGLDGPRATIAVLIAPDNRAIAATLTVAAVGFALLIMGGVRLVLNRGEPMSHAEIEEDIGRIKYGAPGRANPLSFRASTYRHFGPANGAKMERELSIGAMKEAWRSGAWRHDRNWRTVFMMAAGGLMMTYGGFGAAVVGGPLLVKVLCVAALGYATYQLVAALRRG